MTRVATRVALRRLAAGLVLLTAAAPAPAQVAVYVAAADLRPG